MVGMAAIWSRMTLGSEEEVFICHSYTSDYYSKKKPKVASLTFSSCTPVAEMVTPRPTARQPSPHRLFQLSHFSLEQLRHLPLREINLPKLELQFSGHMPDRVLAQDAQIEDLIFHRIDLLFHSFGRRRHEIPLPFLVP